MNRFEPPEPLPSHPWTLLRSSMAIIRDVALPPRCLGCTQMIPMESSPALRRVSRDPLCPQCLPKGVWPPPACRRCLLELDRETADSPHHACDFCRDVPPPRPLIRIGAHTAPLREMLLAAKWGGGDDRVPALAGWLAKAVCTALGSPPPIDAVMGVPRSLGRRIRHGRPLSESLAGELARTLRRRCLAPIGRRGGPPQTSLDGAARRNAPQGAFRVSDRRARRVKGVVILLVDDVVTTGATLDACAVALEAAGARRVIGAVITSVPPPR